MSTLYSINHETATSVSGTDQFPMYKTSTGRTMKVSGNAIRTYVLGITTSEALGFFGATATAQPVGTNQTAVASTAAVSISATQWGYSTSTQASGIPTLLIELRSALVSLGLIKGSI